MQPKLSLHPHQAQQTSNQLIAQARHGRCHTENSRYTRTHNSSPALTGQRGRSAAPCSVPLGCPARRCPLPASRLPARAPTASAACTPAQGVHLPNAQMPIQMTMCRERIQMPPCGSRSTGCSLYGCLVNGQQWALHLSGQPACSKAARNGSPGLCISRICFQHILRSSQDFNGQGDRGSHLEGQLVRFEAVPRVLAQALHQLGRLAQGVLRPRQLLAVGFRFFLLVLGGRPNSATGQLSDSNQSRRTFLIIVRAG